MAKKNAEAFNARKYMEMALDAMNESIQEPRTDKVSPKVGALIIKPNGNIETAFRGELRHGDHAEFTLLERKNRSEKLDGSILFATLEPCAPGARKHPKLCCAERIVNARIKKVYIGIEDPDPSVDRKGLKFLMDHGIEVEMFDPDLQDEIREANKQFIEEAEIRAKQIKTDPEPILLSVKEKPESSADLDDLNQKEVTKFINKAELDLDYGSEKFLKVFQQLNLLERSGQEVHPTGLGLLLFGQNPQRLFENAVIRATYRPTGRKEQIETFKGPLINQTDDAMKWFERMISHQVDRSTAQRQVILDYPTEVIREALTNAVVHRDYDINGAPIYFEISDDAITIKSPGQPVPPLTLDQIKNFNAPSLSRNPKIMYVFDQLDLVEQRGLGFQSMKELPSKHELPLPIVSYDAPYMTFTFPRNSAAVRNVSNQDNITELTSEELAGYEWLRNQREVAPKDYATAMDYSQRTASRHLSRFVELQLATTNGENSRSKNLRYRVVR